MTYLNSDFFTPIKIVNMDEMARDIKTPQNVGLMFFLRNK